MKITSINQDSSINNPIIAIDLNSIRRRRKEYGLGKNNITKIKILPIGTKVQINYKVNQNNKLVNGEIISIKINKNIPYYGIKITKKNGSQENIQNISYSNVKSPILSGGEVKNNKHLFDMNNFYTNYLLIILTDLIQNIKTIFNDGDSININDFLKTIKEKKIQFDSSFKNISKSVSDKIFDKKKFINDIILKYDETIEELNDDLKDNNEEKKKIENEIKSKSRYEEKIKELNKQSNKLQEDVVKTQEYLNNGYNIKNFNRRIYTAAELTASGHQPADGKIITRKIDEIKSKTSRISNLAKNKKNVESNIKRIKNLENDYKFLNKEIKLIQKKIKLINEKKEVLVKKIDKNSQIFKFESLKDTFIEFYNINIKISRIISDIIEDNQKKKKQDIFKYFFDNDHKLQNIIKLLNNELFQSRNNENGITESSGNENTSMISSKDFIKSINYNQMKYENNKLGIIIDQLKIYTQKINNNNYNNNNLKKNIVKKIESILNNKNNQENNNENKSGGFINYNLNFNKYKLIDEITEYINDLQSKNQNVNNKLFFLKVVKEINNYETNDDSTLYFDKIQEIHSEITKKITNNINELNENQKGYLSSENRNESLINRMIKEINYYENEYEKMKLKYQKKSKKSYEKSNKIYVFTYTDVIKFYFIILHLIELYTYNF